MLVSKFSLFMLLLAVAKCSGDDHLVLESSLRVTLPSDLLSLVDNVFEKTSVSARVAIESFESRFAIGVLVNDKKSLKGFRSALTLLHLSLSDKNSIKSKEALSAFFTKVLGHVSDVVFYGQKLLVDSMIKATVKAVIESIFLNLKTLTESINTAVTFSSHIPTCKCDEGGNLFLSSILGSFLG